MDRSLVLRRLCWKEYRQLWPLMVMLAVMASVFQCFLLLDGPNRNRTLPIYFFFGFPSLFAAGVGALLVGQEKESRTLYWMASLPIRGKDIIGIKFLAGFVGLFAVWTISFFMLLVTGGLSNDYGPISLWDIDLPNGILYSIFLLVLGFATAWSFQSTFVGLLVLTGVALAYTFSTSIFFKSDTVNTILLLTTSAIALCVGWVYALRSLSPTASPVFRLGAIPKNSSFDRSIADQRAIQTPWSALLWQFGVQNRAILLGISAMFLVSLLVCWLAIRESTLRQWQGNGYDWNFLPGPAVFMGFIAISWLGVVSFQGDNLHHRIRFLADRGIAPRTVWMTRQFIPFSMLILATLTLAIAAAIALIQASEMRHLTSNGLLVATAIGCMWTIYSVTQWMSQVLRSPIIAAILAPLFGLLPFALGSYAWEVFDTPFWILAVVTIVPMIATYRMTQRWMDGQMTKRFWLEHSGWLALYVLFPVIPFLVVFATYPSMPASEWAAFGDQVQKVLSNRRSPIEVELLAPHQNTSQEELSFESAASEMGMGDYNDVEIIEKQLPMGPSFVEERTLQWDYIERQLRGLDDSSPISSSYNAMKRLMGDAMLARVRMEDEGHTAETLRRYQRDASMIIRIIRGVRLMPDLKSQQLADQYETWLVKEVLKEGARDRFGAEVWSSAVAQLSDKSSRRKARLRALAYDFYFSSNGVNRRFPTQHSVGGFAIPTGKSGTRLISSRHVSNVAWHMKQLLDAKDDSALKQAYESVARDWDTSESRLGQTATTFSNHQAHNVPCSLWHGEWEKQADALK